MTFPITKISQIAKFTNGLAFRPDDWGSEGRPIIRIQNLNDPLKPYNYTKRKVPKKYLVNKGDILVYTFTGVNE
jgi:type I restriction enzyme S subunit